MNANVQVTVMGERAELFQKVFGTDTVCVMSHLPQRANLPEIGEQNVYMLDMNEVTTEQREKLKGEMARRFGLLEDEVDELINSHGVPILAENCVLNVFGAGLGLLLDDSLGGEIPDNYDPVDDEDDDIDTGDTVYFGLDDEDEY